MLTTRDRDWIVGEFRRLRRVDRWRRAWVVFAVAAAASYAAAVTFFGG